MVYRDDADDVVWHREYSRCAGVLPGENEV